MSVALVTGAAIRVGRAIAIRLAKDGFDIALHFNGSQQPAIETAQVIEQLGRKVKLIQCDLSALESGYELIDSASELGSVTVLVNSAAIFPDHDSIDDDLLHWDKVMGLNLKAPLMLTQAFARTHPENGHVINILDARINQPAGDHLVYRLSKVGLWHLTESLAKELAPHIKVNGLALGAIMAPPGADDLHFKRMANRIPLKKTGCPELVANAVSFLVKQEFITGTVLPLDGGEFL